MGPLSLTLLRSLLLIILIFNDSDKIRHLGFAEYSFPSATHTRYVHSLGAMETATQVYEAIFAPEGSLPSKQRKMSPHVSTPKETVLDFATVHPKLYEKYRAMLRLAALLHDIGHGPLSHSSENAMPELSTLGLSEDFGDQNRQATHEDYTLKILLDSPFTQVLDQAGRSYGFGAREVACLVNANLSRSKEQFEIKLEGESIDFYPILHQLVSGELDADRMDYLRRDALCTGVTYGHFDFDWLAGNLTAHVHEGRTFLGLQHRALYSFEDFLISRFHMFLMVYFHYKSVIYDAMLGEFFKNRCLSASLRY